MHIRIIHWKIFEIKKEIERLKHAGHRVDAEGADGQKLLKSILQNIPDVIVIDLDRLPSQGRDVAIHFRKNKATRYIPIIFVGGAEDKLRGIKSILPDALYSDWTRIYSALKDALDAPLKDVHVPKSVFEAYRDKALFEKLGIKENMHVDFINSPANFIESLHPLPEGVKTGKKLSSRSDLLIWFVRTKSDLIKEMKIMRTDIAFRSLWIIWPKKSGNIDSDLTQQVVRETGLSAGLVDFKICSLDQDWSGLLFRKRKKTAQND